MANVEFTNYCATMIEEFSLVYYNNLDKYNSEQSKTLLNVWVSALQPFTISKLEEAKQYVLRNNTRMPVPADLINAIKVIKDSKYYKK